MKNLRLYPKLAITGIKKNRRFYFPYILTCIGMIMMLYIMNSLSDSPLLSQMEGGRNVSAILSIGKFVIAIFALIFLTYTSSFVNRRRNREFGLYNILGMDKKGLRRIIGWESLFVSLASLTAGILLGIAFSKFAELGLLNFLKQKVDFSFSIGWNSIVTTVLIFAVIFVLLYIKSLISVSRTKPLDLFKSRSAGEKPPKGNYIIAILGVLILAGAYYIAVTIKTPLKAIMLFFVAVIMVIIATYMLFTAGSVAMCRTLQNKKNYYYKKNHFVSLSSMVFRMKRNGAGLASICVLSTMVLVMFSSTASLYIGAEDSLSLRYPYDSIIGVYLDNFESLNSDIPEKLMAKYAEVSEKYGVTPTKTVSYGYIEALAMKDGSNMDIEAASTVNDAELASDCRQLYIISEKDYNGAFKSDINLGEKEAQIGCMNCTYGESVISLGGVELSVACNNAEMFSFRDTFSGMIPTVMVIIKDYDVLSSLSSLKDNAGNALLRGVFYRAVNLDMSDGEIMKIHNDYNACVSKVMNNGNGYGYFSDCRAEGSNDFYTTYGGLFFLGIMLCIVFIFATVLIIYYKQVSEGYEDISRFEIMQKVGMTKSDIKKSINSQILTVFYAPLVFAGCHLAFSFPMIWKILPMFGLTDMTLAILTNAASFVIFGIFYALIYKLTAHSYYKIVSKIN